VFAPATGNFDAQQARTQPGSTPAFVAVMVAVVRVWRARRRARRQLSVMSARELEDIGICRPEITREIGKPSWRK